METTIVYSQNQKFVRMAFLALMLSPSSCSQIVLHQLATRRSFAALNNVGPQIEYTGHILRTPKLILERWEGHLNPLNVLENFRGALSPKPSTLDDSWPGTKLCRELAPVS